MKVILIKDLVSPLHSIHEEVLENDSIRTIIVKVFQSTIHAITYIREIIRDQMLEVAAESIMTARKIIIIGLGNSHAIPIDLQH